MKKITHQQVVDYIEENYDEFFALALQKEISNVLFPDQSKEEKEKYREEVLYVVSDAIQHGVRKYLEEESESINRMLCEEVLSKFSKTKLQLSFHNEG